MKTRIALALFLVSAWTPANGQEQWENYVAIYYLDSASVRGFDSFYYFVLEPGDYWKYIDTTTSFALWWPDDSLYADSDAVANLTELYLENDSLYFRTAQCFNERYEFSGKFRMPPSQLPDHRGKPVLDGILSLYRRGILEQRLRVIFSYELSGD